MDWLHVLLNPAILFAHKTICKFTVTQFLIRNKDDLILYLHLLYIFSNLYVQVILSKFEFRDFHHSRSPKLLHMTSGNILPPPRTFIPVGSFRFILDEYNACEPVKFAQICHRISARKVNCNYYIPKVLSRSLCIAESIECFPIFNSLECFPWKLLSYCTGARNVLSYCTGPSIKEARSRRDYFRKLVTKLKVDQAWRCQELVFEIPPLLIKGYIIKRLLNEYRKIFGIRSYGGDALASSYVLAI